MDSPIDYSHLISLAMVLAATTWFATWHAEKRRGQIRRFYNWDIGKFLWVAAQLLVAYAVFFGPAYFVAALLWSIFSPPSASIDIAVFKTVLQSSVQLGSLLWVGANFADLASTYGRTSFRKHMQQYLIAIVPAYLVTVGLASLGAQALALLIPYQQFQIARRWWLLSLPVLTPRSDLNPYLVAAVVIAYGAVSYRIRKRGERLGETDDEVGYTYEEPVPIRERILAAIRVEEENPREAMKLYRQAKKQNEEFSLLIFIVSFAAPLLASVLALRLSQISQGFSKILEYAIAAYIGFGVPTMLRAFRDRRNGVVSFFAPADSRGFWINALFTGPFFLVRKMWLILTALLFTFLVLSPLLVVIWFDLRDGVMNDPSLIVGLGLLMPPVFCIFLLLLWVDIRMDDLFPPNNIVNILFAALRRNILEVLGNLSIMAAGGIVVSLQSNYSNDIFTPLHLALIGGALSGLFLALALSRGDLSTDVKVFVSLGMSRCHIRLGNWATARVLLRPVDRDDICECLVRDDSKKLCEWLSGQLWSVIEGIRLRFQPRDLGLCIDRAKEIVESDVSDREIWIKNIKANRVLVEGEEIRTALDRATKRRRWVKPIVLSPLWKHFLESPILWGILIWGVVIFCFLWWWFRLRS